MYGLSKLFVFMTAIGIVFVVGRVIGMAVDHSWLELFQTFMFESLLLLLIGVIGLKWTSGKKRKEQE